MSFSASFQDGFTKVSGISGEAARIAEGVGSKSEGLFSFLGRLGGGVGKALSSSHEQKNFARYSYKLPSDAKEWQKYLHYGVTPVLAAHNIHSDIKNIKEMKNIDPQSMTNVKLKPEEIDYIKTKARNKAIGKTVGDALSWGLTPLQLKNKALNVGVGVGGGFGLPAAGEYLGGKATRIKE